MVEFKNCLPIGNTYGKWTLVEEVDPVKGTDGKHRRKVRLVCECGAERVATFMDVKAYTENASCKDCAEPRPLRDLSGIELGKLKVIAPHKVDNKIRWECSCSCGRSVYLTKTQIEKEQKLNCGHCANSSGTMNIGDKRTNKEGFTVTLLRITKDNRYIVIGDGCSREMDLNYSTFKNCTFTSPYKITVGGKGYFGEGDFISKVGDTHTPEYRDWSCMMKRCYTNHCNYKNYEDVDVYESWHNFQNFAEWCTKQPNFGKKGWRLDKDLLGTMQGIRQYSPTTCVYLPQKINSFIKTKRINDLPLGVDRVEYKSGTKYRAQVREDGHNATLGIYYTPEEAFVEYKEHKEQLARKIAKEYTGILPDIAIYALYNYEVLESF